MILVMLGTQDKSFERLLKKIDELIITKKITEEVIVQAGYTKYNSDNMKIFDYVSQEELNKLIIKCDFIISHAGVGSILNSIENNKKVIVVPRLKEFNEHNNNHQLEIAKAFSDDGYILYTNNLDELGDKIKEVKNFIPKKLIHNEEVINTIDEFIDSI